MDGWGGNLNDCLLRTSAHSVLTVSVSQYIRSHYWFDQIGQFNCPNCKMFPITISSLFILNQGHFDCTSVVVLES